MARPKKKKKRKPSSLTLVGVGLLIILVAIAIGYLSWLGRERASLPFEEVYVSSQQLSRDIGLIDKSIADGFYKMGVPQEKIVFLSVLPRQKNSRKWDFTSIEARIPCSHLIPQIGEEISTRISMLPIPAQIKADKRSDNEIVYAIYYKGLYTHRLRIIQDVYAAPHRTYHPKIGIIIDDLGYDSSLARAFLTLDLPLTLSVLPFTPHTRLIARQARKEGRETMLHLPMEPLNYPSVNPGDGVLLVSMNRERILQILNEDLSQIPFVAGVNNHMGSRFTENKEKMLIVLSELKKRGLYFIDSRTSSSSIAFHVAKEMDLRTACRDIFLDNHLDETALKIQMERLLSVARHKGRAIGIGHPHKETLDLLKGYRTTLISEAEAVPISKLIGY